MGWDWGWGLGRIATCIHYLLGMGIFCCWLGCGASVYPSVFWEVGMVWYDCVVLGYDLKYSALKTTVSSVNMLLSTEY
jgi:hypothetical protein